MVLNDWLSIAEQNREVDFCYKNCKYSISVNNYGRWFLTKYSEPEKAQEYNSFKDLIFNSYIEKNNFFKSVNCLM